MRKSIRAVTVAVACVLFALCATGCASNVKTTDNGSSSSNVSTVSFTDSAGRTVDIPANVDRIVGTGPLAQQVLLTMDPDKLVGLSNKLTDDQAKYLGSSYASLPVFGQLYGGDLNKEALASADPQLIIDIGEAKSGNVDDLNNLQEELGVPVIYIAADMNDFASTYKTLGQVLGDTDRGNKLADYCSTTYKKITDGMATIPDAQRVRVLYCTGDTGTNVLGKGGYQAQAIDLICDNVAVIDNVSSKGTGNQVSLEQIANWNPDMILFSTNSEYSKASTADVWSSLTAVSNGNYYEVPDAPYNWLGNPPSINRYLGIQWLARICYPSVFTDDLYTTVSTYYKTFYNYDLSKDEYSQLTAHATVTTLNKAA